MPVEPTESITPSLPGGALRLDVNASNINNGVNDTPWSVSDPITGLAVVPQFGAEVIALGGSSGGNPYTQLINAFAPLTFQSVEVDYAQWGTPTAQVDVQSGVFRLPQVGIYELGCAILFSSPTGSGSAVQLSCWTDYGNASLDLNPTIAFGTQNSAYFQSWQRIGQKTQGFNSAMFGVPSTRPDAPGHAMTAAFHWVIRKDPGISPTQMAAAIPPPARFRWAVRTNISNPMVVLGGSPYQTRAWVRWLGDPGLDP